MVAYMEKETARTERGNPCTAGEHIFHRDRQRHLWRATAATSVLDGSSDSVTATSLLAAI